MRLTTAFVISCAIVLALLVWHDLGRSKTTPGNRPVASEQPGYVTSNSCRACHPGNYASWHASFHRTMTQVASSSTVLANIAEVELTFADRQYKLTRSGD